MRCKAILLFWTLLLAAAVSLSAQTRQSISALKLTGTSRIGHPSPAAAASGNEIRTGPEVDVTFTKPEVTGTISPARVPAAHVPTPAGSVVGGIGSDNFIGFNGLTHLDQRLASGGDQFSLEPPDQGLAVGNGFVLEAVNTALAVYDTTGKLLSGPTA